MKSPCTRDCPRRSAECHCEGNCPEWDRYVKEHAEEAKEIRKAIVRRGEFITYAKERSRKHKKRKHHER